MVTEPNIALATRVKQLRTEKGLTLREFSERSGASYSNLSKVETGKLSPTYDTIQKMATGLDISVSDLLSSSGSVGTSLKKSATRRGEGVVHKTNNYTYETLCSEVKGKRLVPLLATIHCGDRKEFGKLLSHDGEEVVFVLSGKIEVHTECSDPIEAGVGDCVFIDSKTGHGLINASDEDAQVFWVHLG